MLQEYVARQRAHEWRRASAEHQLLVKSRPEKPVIRPRWRSHWSWHRARPALEATSRAVNQPPVQA